MHALHTVYEALHAAETSIREDRREDTIGCVNDDGMLEPIGGVLLFVGNTEHEHDRVTVIRNNAKILHTRLLGKNDAYANAVLEAIIEAFDAVRGAVCLELPSPWKISAGPCKRSTGGSAHSKRGEQLQRNPPRREGLRGERRSRGAHAPKEQQVSSGKIVRRDDALRHCQLRHGAEIMSSFIRLAFWLQFLNTSQAASHHCLQHVAV